jgi:apolipoprotein N-acyltransferase
VVSYYSKQYLTPFGEYIPLRPLARLVSPFVDHVSDFSVGAKVQDHVVDEFTLAPVICYELLSDSLVRNAAMSADAIVAQTNSATFAGTSESAQQLNITRLRAIENAREIVSVSTVGISAHIDINGQSLNRTEEDVATQLIGSTRSNSSQTLANHLGGYAPFLVISLSMLFPLLLRIVRSR